MGKGRSPGKWIKSLLLGKKSSSKSNSSKKNESFKLSTNKDVLGSSEDSLLISAPFSGANASNGVLSEKNRSSHDRDVPSNRAEEVHTQIVGDVGSQEDNENLKLTEAAIKVQAACRGYQAHQTFEVVKGGIIQLQALIRGHLVRRQAVSALYCVKGIVKIQALARGYIVRRSEIGLAVQKIPKDTQCSNSIQVVATSTHAEKLSESVFVQKLLVSPGSAVPLSLSFDPREPSLAWKWLHRWTTSHFWAPLSERKKKSVTDEKNGNCQTVKRKQVKRTAPKSPGVSADDGSISGSNKYKQRPKKDSNSPSISAQEHPQTEIEKNSVKKTRLQNVSDRSEVVTEKRKSRTRKSSDRTVTSVSEQGPSASSERMKDLAVTKPDPEKNPGQQEEDKHDNELNDLKKPSMQNVADRSEGVREKGEHDNRKISDNTVTDVSEQGTSASSEKNKDLAVAKSKESDPEKSLGQREDMRDNELSSPKRNCLHDVSDRPEVVNENRKHSTRKSSDQTVTEVSEQGTCASSEKKKDLAVSKAKESDPEKSLGQQEDKHDNEPTSPKITCRQNVADRSEAVNGKRKHSSRKISDHTATDVSEQGPNSSAEKKKHLAVLKSKESEPEKSLGLQAEDKHNNEPHNDTIRTSMTNGRNEGIQGVNEDLNGGDSRVSNNYQRRASLPANFNDQENELHSTPRLPSYMAPTESAKAKLRAQGSPRFATDFADKNSITRRHSLSTSFNGKSESFSPRAERLIAMSSRGALRSDRSLSSSRDATDKLIQPQWRR